MSETARLFFDLLKRPDDVSALVGRNEDLYFEAKTCSTPFSEADQCHLAEALTGFANGDGGVLVYGLVAQGGDRSKPDVVTRVDRVKKVDLLSSQVLALVGQLAEPPIPNVHVVPMKFERLPEEGFVIVYVPASDLGPHRSRKDREYYRRHGHGFFRMEHFEIAEMFGRRRKPALDFFWKAPVYSRCVFKARSKRMEVRFLVGIHNAGRGLAKYPALWISGARPHEGGIDGNGSTGLPQRAISEGYLFGGGADHTVYPGSSLEVTTLLSEFNADSPEASWADIKLEYKLFAEEMAPVKGEINILGADLYIACGSPAPITYPSS